MTPARAKATAADFYYLPDAAAILLVAATAPEPSEIRTRACGALRWLDGNDVVGHELALDEAEARPDPLWPVALAWAQLLCHLIRETSRGERQRLTRLLQALCREAARLGRRRGVPA